ncbi:hypothetical protein G4422_03610 [Blautia wexlerae]|nr:hypothetical protein [Blautia wexlerae]NSF76215.1 hypothetical protein [Blautia wexlerae]
MNDESEHQEWILCPKCGNKTRLKLRKDTLLTNFPLFCPKCKEKSLIDAEKFIVRFKKAKTVRFFPMYNAKRHLWMPFFCDLALQII